jgi:hypothetical protein
MGRRFQQDLAHIKAGDYKLPWDMTTLSHRQYNPLYAAAKSVSFVAEAIGTLDRRVNDAPTNNWFRSSMYPDYYMVLDGCACVQTRVQTAQASAEASGCWLVSTPVLFFHAATGRRRHHDRPLQENTFHYQNNGWLSKDSADVYEFSTESLFFGGFGGSGWAGT